MEWQKYVQLSPDFTPEQRAQMERALDFIAQACDGEGITLLQAAANQAGRPVTIAPSTTDSFHLLGVVGISFDQVSRMTVDDTQGNPQHLSLNGVLVHELFHAAQPADVNVNGFVRDLMGSLPADLGLSATERTQLTAELRAMCNYQINQAIVDRLEPGFTRRPLERQAPDTPIFDQYSERLAPLMSERITSLLDGRADSEQEATRFTDAFMQKNAGRREPMRRDYDNGDISGPAEEVRVLSPTGERFPTLGFLAPQGRKVPEVAPEALSSPSPGTPLDGILPSNFNLSTLARCSVDNVPCAEAQTGTMNAPTTLVTATPGSNIQQR